MRCPACLGVECNFVFHFLQTYKTIGDRQFVSFVQFYLHKYGEVTLGRLRIRSSRNGNGPIITVNEEYQRDLPLAVAPIPENVKKFESILIKFVFTIKFIYNNIIIQRFRPIRYCFSAKISAEFPVRQCESVLLCVPKLSDGNYDQFSAIVCEHKFNLNL
jgi:hypothetical protein